MAFSPWRRRVATLVTAAVLGSTTAVFAQPAPDAKASLADAAKAEKAKDWAAAARLYDAAYKAQPSAEALEGLANAEYRRGELGGAFAAYAEWKDKYAAKAPAAKKKLVEGRLKELEAKTGVLTITVAEPGATVRIDERDVGVSPLPGPVRVTPGEKRIRVTKDGFPPAEHTAQVAAGASAAVTISLQTTSAKGKVIVKERSGKPVRVVIDGVDMGEAPWTGEIDPGQHEISARGQGLVAQAQKVDVGRGKTQEIVLDAATSTAPVKIGTSDAKGLIYIDGKLVGEGSFVGDIPSGVHVLKVTREGYDPFEEKFEVKDKEPFARTVTLKLSSKIETGPMVEVERLEGVYGGFSLLGMATPGGTGNDVEKLLCDNRAATPELAGCEAPDGLGGGLGAFIGYHWDPVGIELFVAGQFDQRTMKTDWNAAATDPGIGPDPARLEEYILRRAGGMGVARVRLTLQAKKVRFSIATGVGFTRRILFFERETRAKDASGDRDVYVSGAAGYWSPIVSLEPAVMFRFSNHVAAGAGIQLFLDAPNTIFSGNGGQNPRSTKESGHRLGERPLATNEIDLASNLQIYVGPFIGMMFGP
jgi:hypothetical protein